MVPSALVVMLALAALQAGDMNLSPEHADAFTRKILLIARQAESAKSAGTLRVTFTETELNSWFAFDARPIMPKGITEPTVTMLGNGRVAGRAIVDMDAVAKQKASGGTLDPWSYVGGKMPVFVTGVLHTKDGVGRFELGSAEVSGVPVPKALLSQLVAYYSRTPDHPSGVDMDAPFDLPADIRRIEVGEGRAVVVQ